MALLGFLLIFLSIPLFVLYALADAAKKNTTQLRLGFVLAGVGLLIALLSS
jgi:hypothetical protein